MNLKSIISKLSSFFSLQRLIDLTGVNLILPFYHTVSDVDLPHIKHLYPVLDTKRFREDLDFLLQRFKPISSEELISLSKKKPLNSPHFFLSFDDGLSEAYHVIAPILKEKGVPATFFLNTDFIDNKGMFYRLKASLLIEKLEKQKPSKSLLKEIIQVLNKCNIRYENPTSLLKISYQSKGVLDELAQLLQIDFDEYLKEKKPYLNSFEINSLISQGFSIGSHSCSHPYYYSLSEAEQIEETLHSLEFLQKNFTINEKLFSFPYTDFDVRKSFFEKIAGRVELSFGTASLKKDSVKTNLQRIPMERKNSAEAILKEEYLLFYLKKIIGKHQIIRE